MQVLCKPTQTSPHICCTICGAGFHLYWERTSRDEQEQRRQEIQRVLEEHHLGMIDQGAQDSSSDPHPPAAFTVPSWNGLAKFSGAALLGGFTDNAA